MNIEGWTQKSLGSFTQFIKGITYASEDYCKEDEGAIFLTIKCVSKSGGFKLEGIKYYRGIIHENEKLKEGDILISNTDLTRDGDIVGCPIMVPFLGANEVTMSMDLSKLVIDLFQIDSKFLYYKLMTDKVRRFMQDHASGSTVLHLQTKAVPTLELLIPDKKEEQEKIAEVLSTIDHAIAQTEAIIVKQQRIKTGLMQDLLTKGIDENGNIRSEATHEFKDSAIGRIPVEWNVELLDKLGERGSGHTPNKSHSNYWNGGIKWVSLADSSKLDQIYIFDTDKEISIQGLKNSSAVLHPKGTVILSRDAGVGKSAILGTKMAVSQHFIVWRCGTNLNNYYLYYWLQKEKPKFEGIASGSTIVTIGLQFFRQYQIAIPKLIDEQNLIAEIIKKSDESISKHRCSLEKLKRRKTGLMQDLLTGKVRVTNLLN